MAFAPPRKVLNLGKPPVPKTRLANSHTPLKARYKATPGVLPPPGGVLPGEKRPVGFLPGLPGNPGGKPRKTLMGRVRQILKMKSRMVPGNTRLDDVAEAFVMAMTSGSFVHLKEYIDREEGKVPTRLADAEGGNLKLYVGMPTDDDPNAP